MSRDAEARRLYLALCSLQRDEFWDSTWHFPQTGKNGFGSVSFLQGGGWGVDGEGDWVMLMPGEGAILWFSVRQWPIVVVAPHWSPWDRSSAEGIRSSGELLSLETPRFSIFFFPRCESTPDDSPQHSFCSSEHLWSLDFRVLRLPPRWNRISRGPFLLEECHRKKK